MINLEEALRTITECVKPLEAESIELVDLSGRVLTDNITAPINVSGFRNSAMDGFAVKAENLKNCSAESPVILPIQGVTYAGDNISSEIKTSANGAALKIMTGAAVPDDYDTVIKIEDTSSDESSVTFTISPKLGDNIRPAGEDLSEGQTIFKSGHQISSLEIGILASIGLTHVDVHRQPNISIFTTGDELIEPGGSLKFGQIYNSNRYTITSLIKPFCKSIEHSAPIADSDEALRKALSSNSEIIITSGGVSAGDKDLIPKVAQELGWKQQFHKIAMKPGKPVFFATRGSQLLFGLPGNPLSTAVSCATLVIPALKKLAGVTSYLPKPVPATLRSESRAGKRLLLWPGKIEREGANLYAEYSPKKSSASLSALSNTDGLIIESQNSDDSKTIEPKTNKPKPSKSVEVLFWNDLLS